MFRCEKCGAEDFKSKAAVSMHRRKCDGVKRTAKERKKLSMDAWYTKKHGHAPGTQRPGPRPKSRGKADASELPSDDDDDIDTTPPTAPPRSAPAPYERKGVPCLTCGDRFPNARDLGIHQSRVHFNETMRRNGVV